MALPPRANIFSLQMQPGPGEPGFVSINKPNSDAVTGVLSGKAMLPQFPVPLINEAALVISPEYYTISGGQARYHLKASLILEIWIPRYRCDFTSSAMSFWVMISHYNVTQPGSQPASQEDAKYLASANPNGVQAFYSSLDATAGVGSPGSFLQVTTAFPIYLCQKYIGVSSETTTSLRFSCLREQFLLILG